MGIPVASLPATLDFMRLLWAVDHSLQRRSKRMEGALGVTGPQRLAIRVIARFPGIAPSELAAALHLHRSTVTGILKRLEARGFLEHVSDPDDGRRKTLALTPAGRVVEGRNAGTAEAAVRRALQRFASTDIDAAARVLRLVADELERGDR